MPDRLRLSGEPYITHPHRRRRHRRRTRPRHETVAAALLHDAVEDTGVTLEAIEDGLRPAVAAIVDGVTKLDRLHFDSKEAQQAATVRKMLVAMAKDWRVLVIKLADRLHNMRTLVGDAGVEATPHGAADARHLRPARAPPRDPGDKWQLEDLSFATLHPKRYAEIEQMVATRAPRSGRATWPRSSRPCASGCRRSGSTPR